jgi:hypothetical protein
MSHFASDGMKVKGHSEAAFSKEYSSAHWTIRNFLLTLPAEMLCVLQRLRKAV